GRGEDPRDAGEHGEDAPEPRARGAAHRLARGRHPGARLRGLQGRRMTCRDLERWLDDGSAPEHYLEAMAHARICAHCSAALAAVDELDTLPAHPAFGAPEGFTDRLMAKVAETRQGPARIPVMELLPFF